MTEPVAVWATVPANSSKLRLSGTTILDSSGNGQVLLYPETGNTEWLVSRVTVRTNQGPTQTPYPQAELYDSMVPTQSETYGATYSGHNDWYDASADPIRIGTNDAILVVWTGGIPGTAASVTIRGTIIRGS